EVLLRRLDPLADRLRNLLGFTRTVAHNALAGIADDDQRCEAHVLAALDHLGHAINADNLILEVHSVAVESLACRHCFICFLFICPRYTGPGPRPRGPLLNSPVARTPARPRVPHRPGP